MSTLQGSCHQPVLSACSCLLCKLRDSQQHLLQGEAHFSHRSDSSTRWCQVRQNSLPQGLLIVSQLDHKRHLEGFLQPLGEHEGNQVPQVQRIRGRPLQAR